MTVFTLDSAACAVHAAWSREYTATYPYIWLRDNCPSNFHPQTRERVFDLFHIPSDVEPVAIKQTADALKVTWRDGHVSHFSFDWLQDHTPGFQSPDPAEVPPQLWRQDFFRPLIPAAEAHQVLNGDGALYDWMLSTKSLGLGLMANLDDDTAGMAVARHIGFLRETNFGTTFDVVSKPDPNNLAYTSIALPLHTDLTNQETPPGFQFLHCVANEAVGGESVFCDGFAIAEDLRHTNPEAFRLLSETYIPMWFHDETTDLRKHERVIITDHLGKVVEIRFNAHLAGVFDLPPEQMAPYYEAYRMFMNASRDPAYHHSFKLGAGEMVVFDNRRILHGRARFDPNTGYRFLRGCYVDRGEWDSRLRLLAKHTTSSRAKENVA